MISQEDVKNFDLLREKQDSKDLKKYLIDKGCLCGDNEHEQERRVALHILETIVNEWTFEQYKKHNNNPIVYPALITFGSYRLGVHRRDSDIDVLSLFADTVSREDFFSSFPEFLAKDKRVSKLLSVKNAYTPVVKFYLNGIHIDALFGNVSDANKLIHFHNNKRQQNHDTSREEYTIVDTDLSGLDQPGVRSLNGVRVTQFIENSISNMERFRICLGAIKEWAVLNGVYSNQMGFLGGINFAILLTKICIDYPESESLPPTALLKLFFYTYSLWEWPEPVMLTKTLQYETPLEIDTMQCWDPTLNSRDVMPIITPAYPSMNSSYNVGLPQKRRIQEEMIRATILLWQEEEEVDDEKERGWSVILKEADFFKRHSNFIHVSISSADPNPEECLNWLRFCQSKIRLLISSLETQQTSAWPFSKNFNTGVELDDNSFMVADDESTTTVYESSFFIALRFAPLVEKVNLKQATSQFLHQVNSWEGRKAGMDLKIEHILQKNLPSFINNDDIECESDSFPAEQQKETLPLHEGKILSFTTPSNKRPRLGDS